jgi:hypothetical protein
MRKVLVIGAVINKKEYIINKKNRNYKSIENYRKIKIMYSKWGNEDF